MSRTSTKHPSTQRKTRLARLSWSYGARKATAKANILNSSYTCYIQPVGDNSFILEATEKRYRSLSQAVKASKTQAKKTKKKASDITTDTTHGGGFFIILCHYSYTTSPSMQHLGMARTLQDAQRIAAKAIATKRETIIRKTRTSAQRITDLEQEVTDLEREVSYLRRQLEKQQN